MGQLMGNVRRVFDYLKRTGNSCASKTLCGKNKIIVWDKAAKILEIYRFIRQGIVNYIYRLKSIRFA